MNLIETNNQISMTSHHHVSRINSFQNLLNAKGFNMFLTLSWLCGAQWFYISVYCKDDVNMEGWCEFIFMRKLRRALIINNINRSII